MQLRKLFKVFIFSFKEFRNDRCDLRASALTLYTLLSIVPVMAMAFGVAKGFGFKEFLERRVLDLFAGQEEVIQNVLDFSNNLLERTQGGLMAVLGIVLLFYSLIKLIGHIENAFNKIWWVSDDRPLIRKFTDYIAISITASILGLFSSSGNIFITAYLGKFLEYIGLHQSFENLISLGFKLFPFFPIWILFVFFYIFLPNKKVNIKAVTAGGLIAGTLFQVVQITYLKFQVMVSSYNAIYGSFAALPLFLIWLQVSWNIFLFGAEVAFSWENIEALETQDIEYEKLSHHLKKLISIRITHFCVKRFAEGISPASALEIASSIKVPLKIVKVLLKQLIQCEMLLEVSGMEFPAYVPARDIECLTLMDVLAAFETRGEDEGVSVGGTIEYEAIEESLRQFYVACRECPGQRVLKDI